MRLRHVHIAFDKRLPNPQDLPLTSALIDNLTPHQPNSPDIAGGRGQALRIRQPFQPLPRKSQFHAPALVDIIPFIQSALDLHPNL